MATLDSADADAKKAVVSQNPISREQALREEQMAETAARERRRNVFGMAGFRVDNNGSDFVAVDDTFVNHEMAGTSDWGGCGGDPPPTAEQQSWEIQEFFDTTYSYDSWTNYDWTDTGVSCTWQYYDTGGFDLDDPQTQQDLWNIQIVLDDEGEPLYVDADNSCVNPNSGLGQALIAGRNELEFREIAQAAAETPLDISDPEIAASVRAAKYTEGGKLVYNGEEIDPDTVEGQRIVQAREYLEASGPATASGDGGKAPDAEPEATTEASTPTSAPTSTPATSPDAAAPAETATPAPADPKQDPEFQALMEKFDLTPEQMALKGDKPATAAPAAAPAPRPENAF